jgi:hypothetical protein
MLLPTNNRGKFANVPHGTVVAKLCYYYVLVLYISFLFEAVIDV